MCSGNMVTEVWRCVQVNSFVGAFHDAVILYALALNETLEAGGSVRDGVTITRRMWNRTFQGAYPINCLWNRTFQVEYPINCLWKRTFQGAYPINCL